MSNDPSAPYRADPTSPIFSESTARLQTRLPDAVQAPADPYASPSSETPHPAAAHSPTAYAPTAYGPSSAYGPAGPVAYRPDPTGTSTTRSSALALIIVSGISMFMSACVVGIPGLVLGLMAYTDLDATSARRRIHLGWVFYAVNIVVVVIAVIGLVAVGFATASSGGPIST